jgi:hypothetical protein
VKQTTVRFWPKTAISRVPGPLTDSRCLRNYSLLQENYRTKPLGRNYVSLSMGVDLRNLSLKSLGIKRLVDKTVRAGASSENNFVYRAIGGHHDEWQLCVFFVCANLLK